MMTRDSSVDENIQGCVYISAVLDVSFFQSFRLKL